jgi:hypothetical protein
MRASSWDQRWGVAGVGTEPPGVAAQGKHAEAERWMDLPRSAIPLVAPAGTVDRPALPVEELDPGAW